MHSPFQARGGRGNTRTVIPDNTVILKPVIPDNTAILKPVIPAQAGIQTCRCRNLSGITVS
ncbi:hypothetical protein [Neisseria lactamica]|uniref:hypothetical protein n=1 Tax=Neisseria lactamica TaxID=486 RepID=UPI0002D3A2E9|nr:hypothetical protein [Neisseria lactamica]